MMLRVGVEASSAAGVVQQYVVCQQVAQLARGGQANNSKYVQNKYTEQ
jgi:hypothetical protein